MSEVQVLHRLFSHAATDPAAAAEWAPVAIEENDASASLPKIVLTALDVVMTKMTPAGSSPGWVVTRYAAHEGSYACVITSYPDVIMESGRAGFVTHARIVRAPGGQAWLDIAALVEVAEAFAIDDVRACPEQDRLRQYVNLLSVETTVAIREVSLTDLDLPRAFLCDALTGLLSERAKQQQALIALPAMEGTLMPELAQAWAAIPVALQQQSMWAVGVAAGCPVDVVFSTSEGRTASSGASKAMVSFVSRYVNLLLEGPYDFLPVLRNPDITTMPKLADAVSKAEPLSFSNELASSSAATIDMKRPKHDAPQSSASRRELDEAMTSELDRQYRAMEDTLRTYVDQRLAVIKTRPSQSAGGTSPVRKWRWERVLAVIGAIALAAMVIWGAFLFTGSGRHPDPQPSTATGTTATVTATAHTAHATQTTSSGAQTATMNDPAVAAAARRAALTATIVAADKNQKWADGLKALIDTDGAIVSTAVRTLARDLPPSQGHADLDAIASNIDAKSLSSRDPLRRLLVDALNGGTVDGKLKDISRRQLRDLKSQYGVKSKSSDVADIELQSEIILRWMESLP